METNANGDELSNNDYRTAVKENVGRLLDTFGWTDILNALRDATDAGVSSLTHYTRESKRARMNAAMHLNEAREEMVKATWLP